MCLFIVLLFSLVLYFMILPYLEKEKTLERQGKLRAVVHCAVSLMDYYERSLRSESWKTDPSMPRTIEEAKHMVTKNLKEIRYDKSEHLFILDGNGTMLMHPVKPELEGMIMLDVTDPGGVRVFKDMVLHSQRDNEAFVSYIWQSKYSPVILEPQITYARYYWPWDWVVCSSLYTQDITDAMRAISIKSMLYALATAVMAMTLMFFFVYVSFSRPLKQLLEGIHEIHKGNLDHQIEVSSPDEIGVISREFNYMVSALKKGRDKLVLSQSKYRQLTDLLPDIIYEADIDFHVTYLNRSGHALTGYSEENIMQGLSLRSLIDDDAFDSMVETITAGREENFLLTHKVFRKNKTHFMGENNGAVIFDDLHPIGIRGSIRDVTDKIQMEEHLVQAQKMETIGTLAGGLAHDFNNVLAGITSTISLVMYEMDKGRDIQREWLKKHLDIMDISGQRAADMVQQLLTLSRKRETQFETVHLNSVIEDVINLCKNTFDKRISICTQIPAQDAMVYGDHTQIEQVLLNICINADHAMTFMRQNRTVHGGVLDIALEDILADEHFCSTHPESRQRCYWKISVRDTGVGIESNTLAKIFAPFFTTKEKGRGTGLGLSMVYQIIRQHEGFIDVYSEVGIGTTFNLFFPAHHTNDTSANQNIHRDIPQGNGLILVVEDEEILRHIETLMLEKCGYEVITAENGEQAVEVFKKRHNEIKAVFMDLAMPKMSGEQAFLEMIKIVPDVKVLLTSGFRQDERVNKVLTYGTCGFIQKPFTLETVACSIARILNVSSTENQGDPA